MTFVGREGGAVGGKLGLRRNVDRGDDSCTSTHAFAFSSSISSKSELPGTVSPQNAMHPGQVVGDSLTKTKGWQGDQQPPQIRKCGAV